MIFKFMYLFEILLLKFGFCRWCRHPGVWEFLSKIKCMCLFSCAYITMDMFSWRECSCIWAFCSLHGYIVTPNRTRRQRTTPNKNHCFQLDLRYFSRASRRSLRSWCWRDLLDWRTALKKQSWLNTMLWIKYSSRRLTPHWYASGAILSM